MQMLLWPNLQSTSNCFAWLAALASSLSSVVRRAEAAEVVVEGVEGLKPRAAETRLGLRWDFHLEEAILPFLLLAYLEATSS